MEPMRQLAAQGAMITALSSDSRRCAPGVAFLAYPGEKADGRNHIADAIRRRATNPVDGDDVPVPHFGVVLPMEEWKALASRLQSAGVKFVIEPTVRFEGQPGEQATMFFLDPAGNALEFKAMADPSKLFAK